MFLKTFDWKLILKFCVKIICGSHFNRPSGISCEKYDEKCHDQLYFSILVNVCNYWKYWTFDGMKSYNEIKTALKKEAF